MTHPFWLPHEGDALSGQIISNLDSEGKHVVISKWKSEFVLPPKTTRKCLIRSSQTYHFAVVIDITCTGT